MSGRSGVTSHLWEAIRKLSLADVFQADLFLGIAGGVGGLILGLNYPDRLTGAVSIAAGVVGVVIGAVIAGVAIQSAFLDQSFLRKLRAINSDPVDYLTPFLFTTTIGVFALLGLLVLAVLPVTAPTWALATLGTWVGLFSCWSVASLLPGMGTLIQFVGLRQDAIDVPDDVDIRPEKRKAQ